MAEDPTGPLEFERLSEEALEALGVRATGEPKSFEQLLNAYDPQAVAKEFSEALKGWTLDQLVDESARVKATLDKAQEVLDAATHTIAEFGRAAELLQEAIDLRIEQAIRDKAKTLREGEAVDERQ